MSEMESRALADLTNRLIHNNSNDAPLKRNALNVEDSVASLAHETLVLPDTVAKTEADNYQNREIQTKESVLAQSPMTGSMQAPPAAPSVPHRRYPVEITPGPFEPRKHFYEKALTSNLHPSVTEFFSYSTDDYIERYCQLHPDVNRAILAEMLAYTPSHLFWSGVDLLNMQQPDQVDSRAMSAFGMTILETNSCPSGQKSMPGGGEGYFSLMKSFLESAEKRKVANMLPDGALAVIYDKNITEVSGYAQQLSNAANETVFLVELFDDDSSPCARWTESGTLTVLTTLGFWIPIRAAFRYVTQRPWTRIPINSKTFIFNSTLACLAGGRNKLVGHKAYEALNAGKLEGSGLCVRTPKTFTDVERHELRPLVASMGYRVVIKIPYSNAGQGVFTMHSQKEFDKFVSEEISSDKIDYQRFVVQELLVSKGTTPNASGEVFVWDLRFMIKTSPSGYKPLVMYARKAAAPLRPDDTESDSRLMYLTNLSEKLGSNKWGTDVDRLVVLSEDEFGTLGISVDQLIDGYIQAVLASVAIDMMAIQLWGNQGSLSDGPASRNEFNTALFQSMNDDKVLIDEIYELQ